MREHQDSEARSGGRVVLGDLERLQRVLHTPRPKFPSQCAGMVRMKAVKLK